MANGNIGIIYLAGASYNLRYRIVTIDGTPYWDGGYSGNPALWPLIYETPALDLVLVKINPLVREGTPTRSMDIIDRVHRKPEEK